MTDKHRSRGLFLLVALMGSLSFSSSAARIVPLRTEAVFSAKSPQNIWSVPIKSVDGKTIYVLSLEPDSPKQVQPIALDLVLRRQRDQPDAPNRLAPTGMWHGLQPYMFPGRDFAEGVQKSTFGRSRRLILKSLGLRVHITVSQARVIPAPKGNYQFDTLDLQVEVDNLAP